MRILSLFLSLFLAGCHLQPVYQSGVSGATASQLSQVEVAPIAERSGWLIRNALVDRLQPGSSTAKPYILEVEVDDEIEGLGVRPDDSVTRERRRLRARFRLVRASDNRILLDATAGSDSSIDVVSSEYATIAAEERSLENLAQEVSRQMIQRISLYFHETSRNEE